MLGKGLEARDESCSCKQSPINELINIFGKRRLTKVNTPLGSRESNHSSSYIAHIAKANPWGEKGSQCDEARKPKDHGQTIGTEQGVLRCNARKFHRHNSNVKESKDGPDAAED